jgi:hypothetical protein
MLRIAQLCSKKSPLKYSALVSYQWNSAQKWQNIFGVFSLLPACSDWVLFRISDFDIRISGLSGLGFKVADFHRPKPLMVQWQNLKILQRAHSHWRRSAAVVYLRCKPLSWTILRPVQGLGGSRAILAR